jgi:hypothetical protein
MIAERVGPPNERDTPPAGDLVDLYEGRIPVRFAAAMVAFSPDDEAFDHESFPSPGAVASADEAAGTPRTARPPGDVVDTASAPPERHVADMREAEAFDEMPDTVSATESPWSHALFAEYELMETLSAAAVAAAAGDEAANFIAATVPLALRLVQVGSPLWPALPPLIQSATRVTRRLYDRPAARPLIGLMPIMLRRSVIHLAQCVTRGQHITPRLATRIFNQHAAAVLNQRSGMPEATHPPRAMRPPRRSAGTYDMDYHD